MLRGLKISETCKNYLNQTKPGSFIKIQQTQILWWKNALNQEGQALGTCFQVCSLKSPVWWLLISATPELVWRLTTQHLQNTCVTENAFITKPRAHSTLIPYSFLLPSVVLVPIMKWKACKTGIPWQLPNQDKSIVNCHCFRKTQIILSGMQEWVFRTARVPLPDTIL